MNMDYLRQEINTWLDNYFENKGTYNKVIYDSMAYSVKVGGKRIRPTLMLYTYNMFKNDFNNILPIACALEMIHTYSLIHDDLPCMDNDDLRRGKPTNHKVFGEAIAVLAGDGLLNEAMSIMFNESLKGDKNVLEACSIISNAAGVEGMIGGQIVDIISEGKLIDKDQLYYMHKCKTGALIKSSIVAGAILGGASKGEINILDEFGEKLGLIFQIKDDILDVVGETEILGKNAKSDIENNKTTFVTQFGLDKCIEFCESLTKDAIDLLEKLSLNTNDLKDTTIFISRRNH
ncbi:farnesyl diphosphate synthase [Clostridium homopropionicum DSM 5847]|uniref:Farnesyl diphosphate synthase n=1 Tax=Clostridium homopropionicum DSM 5847 TaxID=1121318 RepID=A0A0L6ZD80_9CLOT|nr:farnesyl diphosphate synthase [Clostridium homopropionicum DSM 5847]SFG01820.1 geranylgeranyl diphosphate synthase, type II [Clostridium homopropionicum]